ncbi:hypothetical protein AB5V95_00280 [Metamycoplasma spumans]|uniref:hypothetical protein n=1 Tax=Metamycoplasma spumans TaxID=92406 RepID=UPI0034DCF0B8
MKKSKKHLLSILALSSMTLLSTTVAISCSNAKLEDETRKDKEEIKTEDDKKTDQKSDVENKEDKKEGQKDSTDKDQQNPGTTGDSDKPADKTGSNESGSQDKDGANGSGDSFQPIGGGNGEGENPGESDPNGSEAKPSESNKEYFFSKPEFSDINSKSLKQILTLLLQNKAGFEEFRDDKIKSNTDGPEVNELGDVYLYLTEAEIQKMTDDSQAFRYGHGTTIGKDRIIAILDSFKTM